MSFFIQKIFFSFLLLCLSHSVYSMKNNNDDSLYDAFCRAVELAQENGFSPQNCEIIKNYIIKGADPNWKIGEDEEKVLNLVVCSQNKDLFDFLLEHNADINAGNKNMFTPLHALATTYGIAEKLNIQIKDLVKQGANVEAKTTRGATPLNLAAQSGSIDCIKSLIQCGADINEKSLVYALHNNKNKISIEVIKELCNARASLIINNNINIFHIIVANANDSIQYIKPIITHARFDAYDKGSQTVPYGLFLLKRWETKNMITLPRDVKLHILAQLDPYDLYPYKKLCKELLQKNYNHILLPQVYERVKNIKQILTSLGKNNQTVLEYALDKHANNQEYINNVRTLLDGTVLENNFHVFIENFPAIIHSKLEKDKENLVRQMFDNCAELFLEQ